MFDELNKNTKQFLSVFDNKESGFWIWTTSIIAFLVTSAVVSVVLLFGVVWLNPDLATNIDTLTTLETFNREEAIRRSYIWFLSLVAIFPAVFVAFRIFGIKLSSLVSPMGSWQIKTILLISLGALVFVSLISILNIVLTGSPYSFEPHVGWGWSAVVLMVPIIAIQATTEELVFRGYLLQLVGRFTQNWVIILVIISAIFFAIHLANPPADYYGWFAIASYGLMSLLLTFIVLKTGRLVYSIGLHVGNNWGILFFDDKNTPDLYMGLGSVTVLGEPGVIDMAIMLIYFLGLYLLAMWFYRRRNLHSEIRQETVAV